MLFELLLIALSMAHRNRMNKKGKIPENIDDSRIYQLSQAIRADWWNSYVELTPRIRRASFLNIPIISRNSCTIHCTLQIFVIFLVQNQATHSMQTVTEHLAQFQSIRGTLAMKYWIGIRREATTRLKLNL